MASQDGLEKASKWFDAACKICTSLASIAGIAFAALMAATSFLSTQPVIVLHLIAAGFVLAAIVAFIFAVPAFRRRRPLLGSFAVAAGMLSLSVMGVLLWSIPPSPTWKLLDVPYELTINGDSPLVLARDELVPPGFPGHSTFQEKLAHRRGKFAGQQQYVVYVSSEFTRNRFPSDFRVKKPDDFVIASYIFGRESSATSWQKASHGFGGLNSSLHLTPVPADAARFVIAVVLFPLNESAADATTDNTAELSRFIDIQ